MVVPGEGNTTAPSGHLAMRLEIGLVSRVTRWQRVDAGQGCCYTP